MLPFCEELMGLANASQSYQRYMDSLFQNMEGVYCYLDDLLLFPDSEEAHLKLVEQVLKILHEAGLSLSLDKCQFSQNSLEFLGYSVCEKGIAPR